MGRPKSLYGYKRSRYNRLSHGVEFNGILPSRGVDCCYHAQGCPIAENEEWRRLCVAGGPCPYETVIHDRYCRQAAAAYSRCRAWLDDDEFEAVIHELSILELRRMRLCVLINREGLLRDKRHPVSGYLIGQQMGLGVSRYSDAVDVRFNAAYAKLMNLEEDGSF